MKKTNYIQFMVALLVLALTFAVSVSAIPATTPYFTVSPELFNTTLVGISANTSFTVVNLTLVTADPNGDNLSYAIINQSSADILCDFESDNATISCFLAERVLNAFNTVTYTVSDGNETLTQTVNVTLSDNAVNDAPSFTYPGFIFNASWDGVTVNVPYTIVNDLSVVSEDPNNDTLNFSIVSQSDANLSCLVSGVVVTCEVVQAVSSVFSTVVVEVTDTFGANDTTSFNVSFGDINFAPYFTVPVYFFNTTFTNVSFGDEVVVINNVSGIVADDNGDNISVNLTSQTSSDMTCSLISEVLTCAVTSSVGNAFSTLTLTLDDGKGGVTNGSFNVSFVDSHVLLIENVTTSPSLTSTIADDEQITLNFTSTKFPLNVTVSLIDSAKDIVETYATFELTDASDLPLVITTPTDLADGFYTIVFTATTGSENTSVTVGTFELENTVIVPPTTSSGGNSRSNRNTITGGPGVFVNETPQPVEITEVAPIPEDTGSTESDNETVVEETASEEVGTLIEENQTSSDEITGQFTGGEAQGNLNWLWWIIALIIVALLIWKFAGSAATTKK